MPPPTSGLTVDVVRAEAARFRHPLLLLHGLWTGAWLWSRFAAYLAHRGWDSWAVSFLDAATPPDHAARVVMLAELCASMPAAPVVIAHDAALEAASMLRAPAVVAIAPVVAGTALGPLGLDGNPIRRLAHRLAARIDPPRGRAAARLFGSEERHVLRLRPDSGRFVRTVLAWSPPAVAWSVPGLVLTAPDDVASPVQLGGRVAARLGWSLEVRDTAGHFPMLAHDVERFADHVHRWLVRAIGQALLAWVEDDDHGRE
jgi:hypothetical protein